jgi:hypothetical protein
MLEHHSPAHSWDQTVLLCGIGAGIQDFLHSCVNSFVSFNRAIFHCVTHFCSCASYYVIPCRLEFSQSFQIQLYEIQIQISIVVVDPTPGILVLSNCIAKHIGLYRHGASYQSFSQNQTNRINCSSRGVGLSTYFAQVICNPLIQSMRIVAYDRCSSRGCEAVFAKVDWFPPSILPKTITITITMTLIVLSRNQSTLLVLSRSKQ